MTDKLTPYQEELLALVAAGSPSAGPAEPIDFDELLERLSWQPTKAAAHFSIRALTRRELLAKCEGLVLRRGRKRVCFQLTYRGKTALDPTARPEEKKVAPPGAVETQLEVTEEVPEFTLSEALEDALDDALLASVEIIE